MLCNSLGATQQSGMSQAALAVGCKAATEYTRQKRCHATDDTLQQNPPFTIMPSESQMTAGNW
jgi:hypothetical protein